LSLDCDAALALQVHGVQHLLLHFPVGQAAAQMNDAIGQGGFTMINMGDDGEISNMLHWDWTNDRGRLWGMMGTIKKGTCRALLNFWRGPAGPAQIRQPSFFAKCAF
jgi:hypothetical protein